MFKWLLNCIYLLFHDFIANSSGDPQVSENTTYVRQNLGKMHIRLCTRHLDYFWKVLTCWYMTERHFNKPSKLLCWLSLKVFGVYLCVLCRRGHRPCGRHAVGCWTRWWVRARCGLSSRGSGQGQGPFALPPVLGTPPTPPPAQGVPDSCARPADWPSPSSDAR